MTIDLVPLKHFSDRVTKGWTMVPGYPLQPGDYAVVMQSPGSEAVRINLGNAAIYRNKIASEKRRQLETA